MRTVTAIEFLSVDGVMQGLGSPDEDREGGFEHGGWGAPFAEAVHASTAASGMESTSAYLFGRKTYEKMAAYWPGQPSSDPVAAHLNTTSKYVVSRTLNTPGWPPTTVVGGDVADEVAGLKAQGEGTIAILGSGVLVRSLLAAGLVDRLRLFVHPLLLGSGKRLFGSLPGPTGLTLAGCETTSLGSLVLTYSLGGA